MKQIKQNAPADEIPLALGSSRLQSCTRRRSRVPHSGVDEIADRCGRGGRLYRSVRIIGWRKRRHHEKEPHVTHYEFSIPRTALGLAACALSAITFGVLVVLPATFESESNDTPITAAMEIRTAAIAPTGFVSDSGRLVPGGAQHERRGGTSCTGPVQGQCLEQALP
jgi:hypothetical protein